MQLRSILPARPVAVLTATLAGLVAAGAAQSQSAYITNARPGTVSVIDTRTNDLVGSPIAVGRQPIGVAVTPDGSKVYVANADSDTVSVIATATNAVIGLPIAVGDRPSGVAVTPDGSTVYVTNDLSDTVSVIATATDTTVDTDPAQAGVNPITVGSRPSGVAVTPNGRRVYVTNSGANTVAVIDAATNALVDTDPDAAGVNPIQVGIDPNGVAVTPDGQRVYVANAGSDTVSVIATATNSLVDTDPARAGVDPIQVGRSPIGVVVTPDGRRVYVANGDSDSVSVIDTETNSLVDTDPDQAGVDPIGVGDRPQGVAVTPDGARVYAVNSVSDSVSAIDTATNKVVGDPILVGDFPVAFGRFIQPAPPPFAGTPGAANCAGQSLSAAARRYGGTSAAARALGYGSVAKLQTAIRAFCTG